MKLTTKFIEEFRNKWEGANAATNTISTLMMDRMEEDLKDILTKHEEAVVERIYELVKVTHLAEKQPKQSYGDFKKIERGEIKMKNKIGRRIKALTPDNPTSDNKNYVFIWHNGKRLGNSNVYRDIAEF